MAERRKAVRKRTRLVVDFDTPAARTTGFARDISLLGMFVRTIRIPRIGATLSPTERVKDQSPPRGSTPPATASPPPVSLPFPR